QFRQIAFLRHLDRLVSLAKYRLRGLLLAAINRCEPLERKRQQRASLELAAVVRGLLTQGAGTGDVLCVAEPAAVTEIRRFARPVASRRVGIIEAGRSVRNNARNVRALGQIRPPPTALAIYCTVSQLWKWECLAEDLDKCLGRRQVIFAFVVDRLRP